MKRTERNLNASVEKIDRRGLLERAHVQKGTKKENVAETRAMIQ